MRIRLLVGIAALLLLGCATPAHAQSAVFVIRHAERLDESQDSPLSDAGYRRAQALASFLKDAGITAVYVSDLQRTIKTAEPLARALGVELRKVPQYDGKDMEKLAAELRGQRAADRVLVVGHSNTMPALVKALGVSDEVNVRRDEYDLLLIVVSQPGPPALLRLRYPG
jgi:broad specificity phosphatase PhoE